MAGALLASCLGEKGFVLRVLVAAGEATVRDRVLAASRAVGGFNVQSLTPPENIVRTMSNDIESTDLFLVELNPDETRSVRVLRDMVRLSANTPIAVLTAKPDLEIANRALMLGACGVIDHMLDADAIGHAVRMLLLGNCVLAYKGRKPVVPAPDTTPLSDREHQVLRGICDGLQNKEIAHLYDIKEVTVKMHVRAIIRKLNARNRTHAAMLARDYGLTF